MTPAERQRLELERERLQLEVEIAEEEGAPEAAPPAPAASFVPKGSLKPGEVEALQQEVDSLKPGVIDLALDGSTVGIGTDIFGNKENLKQARQNVGKAGSIAVEALSGLPAAIAAGGSIPAQMAIGGVSGYTHSDAESFGGKLLDAGKGAALSGVVGKGLQYAGKPVNAVREYLVKKYAGAQEALGKKALEAAAQETRSLAGKLGAVTADASRGIEKLERAIGRGSPLADEASELLGRSEIQALDNRVTQSYARRVPGLAEAEAEARAALEASQQTQTARAREFYEQAVRAPVKSAVKDIVTSAPGVKDAITWGTKVKDFVTDPAVQINAIPVLKKVLVDAPQTFGRYAGALTEAASRGVDALAVTDFLLQSQPDAAEYRETRKNLSADPEAPRSGRNPQF